MQFDPNFQYELAKAQTGVPGQAQTEAAALPTVAPRSAPVVGAGQANSSDKLVIEAMHEELTRSLNQLKHAGKAPLYYLSYRLYDGRWQWITAKNGALLDRTADSPWRMLSVDLRVGSPRFDNTHFLRGENSAAPHQYSDSRKDDSILPSAGAAIALRECLWAKTDEAFEQAEERYSQLCASNEVMAQEEDRSGDFSMQPMHRYFSNDEAMPVDRQQWEERVRKLSRIFLNHPLIKESTVSFVAEPTTRYIVNSEGSELVQKHASYRVSIRAQSLAKDGMILWLWDSAESPDPAMLPDQAQLSAKVERLARSLDELYSAPAAEAYVGPAILSGKAAAVFFHETFGHRIEAVHEKSEFEGKTFARKVGTVVMPSFISVVDDPTVVKSHGEFLNGHYLYDDEGVPAQSVTLTDQGVLKGFLLSRTLVQGFHASNGHGRCSPGFNPVARQANLLVQADKSKQVSPQALRKLLIEQLKKQHKSYGLLFDEVAGGYTYTATHTEQTYTVNPLRVYKVFVDGRPDQLIRGAAIVGTPLAALERIVAAGTDSGVFNGQCGRESGPVPVSAVAPSLLVESIEIKRASKSTQRLPILPDPSIPKASSSVAAPASSTGGKP